MASCGTGESEEQECITVFLLDDHELVRRGIRDVLEAEGDIRVVGEAGTVAEAARRIPAAAPDIALLDGRLPDGSGVDVCRFLRSAAPSVAPVILTSYDDDEPLFEAILAGAVGYLLKQVRTRELVDAVRRVAAGQSLLDPGLTAQVLDRIRHDDAPLASPTAGLTPKEREILGLVGEGLSNRQIAVRLGLAEKTVKNYVSTMLGKLGLESRTQAAILAIKGSYDQLPGRDLHLIG